MDHHRTRSTEILSARLTSLGVLVVVVRTQASQPARERVYISDDDDDKSEAKQGGRKIQKEEDEEKNRREKISRRRQRRRRRRNTHTHSYDYTEGSCEKYQILTQSKVAAAVPVLSLTTNFGPAPFFTIFFRGVVVVVFASFISGLRGGNLEQQALSIHRNVHIDDISTRVGIVLNSRPTQRRRRCSLIFSSSLLRYTKSRQVVTAGIVRRMCIIQPIRPDMNTP